MLDEVRYDERELAGRRVVATGAGRVGARRASPLPAAATRAGPRASRDGAGPARLSAVRAAREGPLGRRPAEPVLQGTGGDVQHRPGHLPLATRTPGPRGQAL